MTHFLYAAEVVGYGPPKAVKIGISKNPVARCKALWRQFHTPVKLLKVWEFETVKKAQDVENSVIHHFPWSHQFGHLGRREILAAQPDAVFTYVDSILHGCAV